MCPFPTAPERGTQHGSAAEDCACAVGGSSGSVGGSFQTRIQPADNEPDQSIFMDDKPGALKENYSDGFKETKLGHRSSDFLGICAVIDL